VTWIHLIDWATGIASFGVKFIGFPSQMRRNRVSGRRGNGAGMTVTMAGAMCISYVLWVLHGAVNHDWVEIISQGTGALVTGVLLMQAAWYRRVQGREGMRACLFAESAGLGVSDRVIEVTEKGSVFVVKSGPAEVFISSLDFMGDDVH
jgi:hypothetical protein